MIPKQPTPADAAEFWRQLELVRLWLQKSEEKRKVAALGGDGR